MNVKVTVGVASFNNSKYLDRCINSVLEQSYNNLEIIIVDDGSTDNSISICEKYSRFPIVRIISKSNGGLSTVRQRVIDEAKGSYVCFIDADDYLLPNHVENMLNRIIEDQSDICICSTLFQDSNGIMIEKDTKQFSIIQRKPIKVELKKLRDIKYSYSGILTLSDSWNKMYSFDFLQKTKVGFELPKGFNGSDLAFNHKLVLHLPKYSFVSDATYIHVMYEKSAVHRKDKKLLEGFQNITSQLINECVKLDIINEMQEKISGVYINLLRSAFQDVFNENEFNKETKSAFKFLIYQDKAYRINNLFITTKLRYCATKSLFLFLLLYKYIPGSLFLYFKYRRKVLKT